MSHVFSTAAIHVRVLHFCILIIETRSLCIYMHDIEVDI